MTQRGGFGFQVGVQAIQGAVSTSALVKERVELREIVRSSPFWTRSLAVSWLI